MQFTGYRQNSQLPPDYAILNPEPATAFLATGLLQLMDDCGPKMTFAHADIYSGKGISIGKDEGRLLKTVVLPYRPVRSSRSFTLYEHNDG